jgi:tetratricopeptide (TPR) repeat protein
MINKEKKTVSISMHQFLHGRPFHARGNSRSLEDLNLAIETNPNHVNDFFERAQIFFKKKDYWRAIDDYNQANEHRLLQRCYPRQSACK